MANKLVLSPLGHTWLIDIDGTICKHNGYKIDGHDTLLPGAKAFFDQIDFKKDKIILITSREEAYKEQTESFLKSSGIHFDTVIYGCPYGERILINDDKPSGLKCSKAISLSRDNPMFPVIKIDNER